MRIYRRLYKRTQPHQNAAQPLKACLRHRTPKPPLVVTHPNSNRVNTSLRPNLFLPAALRGKLRSSHLVGIQMCTSFPQQPNLLRQSSICGEEKWCFSFAVTQVDGGALGEEFAQDFYAGTCGCDVLMAVLASVNPDEWIVEKT
jgi:hypothetical protein